MLADGSVALSPANCLGPLVNWLLFFGLPVLNSGGMTMLFFIGAGDRVGLSELRGPSEIPFVVCGP